MRVGDKERQQVPEAPSEAEKERYRQKLAEWRAMGFDTSTLEVLLETDFPTFKAKRLELMRSQILRGEPAIAPPGTLHPAAVTPPPAASPHPTAGTEPSRRTPQEEAHERLHSEMRYPQARRRHGSKVRTFSVSSEPPGQRVGVIQLGVEQPVPGRSRVIKRKLKVKKRPGARGTAAIAGPQRQPGEEEMAEPLEGGPTAEEGYEGAGEGTQEESAIGDAVGEEGAGASSEDGGGGGTGADSEGDGDVGEGESEQAEEQVVMVEEEPGTGEPVEGEEGEEAGEPGEGEGDIEEDMAGAGGRQRAAGGRAGRERRSWAAIAVAVILVVAVPAAYLQLNPPVQLAARGWHPATAAAGENVPFDANNSSASGAALVKFAWDFGDGSSAAGKDKLVYHDYNRTGTFTVMLTVTNERGDTASQRSAIAITPLSVLVPATRIGDSANYDVRGEALAANNDTHLYTYVTEVGQLSVDMVTLQFSGEQSVWVAGEVAQVEDGFRSPHRALHTVTKENLDPISGKAYTTVGVFNIQGALDYTEDAYADPATGGVFNLTSRAHTDISLTGVPARNFTDTLRAYPSVAGMAGQFRLEDIYRGHRFEQGNSSTLSGNLTAGGVRYSWTSTGVDFTGGQPSIALHVTGDQEALRKSGIAEFYVDLYLSSVVSLPTKTSLHVAGLSGDTFYVTDHETELTHFTPGADAIDMTPQSFNSDPLPPSDFSSPFDRVPANGTGTTSLRFSPSDALGAASSDSGLNQFLSQNPAAYAVRGKYYEPTLPLEASNWNLTFSYPGATSGYYINVTREQFPQPKYQEHGNFLTAPRVNTSRAELVRMLTMSAVSAQFQSDTDTASIFFSGGTLQFSSGANLSLQADAVYPAINLAALSATAQTARYAAILQKGAYTSALSMDTGQMMYFWVHTAG